MKKIHKRLQESIDKLLEHQGIMVILIERLCDFLGEIIEYKHTEKSEYRILVETLGGRKYDTDDLLEQANEYVIRSKD